MKLPPTNAPNAQRWLADEKKSPSAGRRRLPLRRAFTLIEIMVSIVIFSIVVAAICSTLILVIRATEVGRVASERAQRQRVVMSTIENSL
ncbi:MAG: prepilin-type N-terminal cleavage/methylation domain-containing protein, partial [Verrucomicrobiota bacterium]